MNCKFHPEAEAVTTCAVCKSGMCFKCNTEAFYELENGQPLCIDCSLKEAAENVVFGEKYLKKMKRKRIWSCVFLVLSIPMFFSGTNFPLGLIFWGLAGLIQTWGHEKDKGTVKSAVFEGQEEFKLSFSKVIFYIVAAPVMLIKNFKEYPKLEIAHQSDIEKLEAIKAASSISK